KDNKSATLGAPGPALAAAGPVADTSTGLAAAVPQGVSPVPQAHPRAQGQGHVASTQTLSATGPTTEMTPMGLISSRQPTNMPCTNADQNPKSTTEPKSGK